jgi:hypothetical protein
MLKDRPPVGGSVDGDRISRARQAAEELFKPKRTGANEMGITAASHQSTSTKQQPPRRRRIIAVQAGIPVSTVKDEPRGRT